MVIEIALIVILLIISLVIWAMSRQLRDLVLLMYQFKDNMIILRTKIGAFEFILRHFMDPEYWPGYDEEFDYDEFRRDVQRLFSQEEMINKLNRDLFNMSEERFEEYVMQNEDIPFGKKMDMFNEREKRRKGEE